MKTWRCPSCGTEVEALATDVGHRCGENRRRWTRFVVVEGDMPPTYLGGLARGVKKSQ